ncbi:hypothetical protein Tcan_00435, partial [Toxocara canis]
AVMLNGEKEENELSEKRQLDGDVEIVEKPEDEQLSANAPSAAFAHSVADGDTMEQLMRMSDSQMSDGTEFVAVGDPVDSPQMNDEISWSTPEIFDEPVMFDMNTKLGDEILSVKAHDVLNNEIEFVCYRPETVFCLTDFITAGNYQLRVVYSSEHKPADFELPFTVVVRHSLIDSSPFESIYEVIF